jgi:hypothetical protein
MFTVLPLRISISGAIVTPTFGDGREGRGNLGRPRGTSMTASFGPKFIVTPSTVTDGENAKFGYRETLGPPIDIGTEMDWGPFWMFTTLVQEGAIVGSAGTGASPQLSGNPSTRAKV